VGRTIKPYERMVSLAAYVAARPEGVGKANVHPDVPG
jgi:hypothetical protein